MVVKSVLFKDSMVYSVGQVVPKVLQFALLPLYLTFLDPSDYGIITSVQTLLSILTIISTFSLERGITRLNFDFKGKDNKTFYGTIFLSVLITNIALLLVCYGFPLLLGSIFKSISFYPIIAIAVLVMTIGNLSIVPMGYFYSNGNSKKNTLLSVINSVLRNAGIVIFLIYFDGGVKGYFLGQLAGVSIMAPYYLFLTFNLSALRFDMSIFKTLVNFSLPLMPSMMLTWVVNLSDRILIERFLSTEDVGLYSLGATITSVVLIVTAPFYKAYTPMYYKKRSLLRSDRSSIVIEKGLNAINTSYIILIVFTAFGVGLFIEEITDIYFPESYSDIRNLVFWLLISQVFLISTGVARLVLYDAKNTRVIMFINLTGAAINVSLNLVLIPKLGLLGAAISTAVTGFWLVTIEWVLASKYDFYRPNLYLVFSILIGLSSIIWMFSFIRIPLYHAIFLKTIICVALIYTFWRYLFSKYLKIPTSVDSL